MPGKHHPWIKLGKRAWLTDPMLRRCKSESRGILADLMILADDGTPCGFLTNSGVPMTEKDLRRATHESYQKLRKCLADLYAHRRVNHVIISKTYQFSFAFPTNDPLIVGACHALSQIVGPTNDPVMFVPRTVRDGVEHERAVEDGKTGGSPLLGQGVKGRDKGRRGRGVNLDVDVEQEKDVREGITPDDGRPGPGGPGDRHGEKEQAIPNPGGVLKKLSEIFHGVLDREDARADKGVGNS